MEGITEHLEEWMDDGKRVVFEARGKLDEDRSELVAQSCYLAKETP